MVFATALQVLTKKLPAVHEEQGEHTRSVVGVQSLDANWPSGQSEQSVVVGSRRRRAREKDRD